MAHEARAEDEAPGQPVVVHVDVDQVEVGRMEAITGRHGAPLVASGAVTTFNHVGHCVTDLERSRRFYEEVLGFTHKYDLPVPDAPASQLLRVPAPVGMTAVYLELDGFTLELLRFDREGNDPQRERSFTEPGLTHLSFTVADISRHLRQGARARRRGPRGHRRRGPGDHDPRPRRPAPGAPAHPELTIHLPGDAGWQRGEQGKKGAV